MSRSFGSLTIICGLGLLASGCAVDATDGPSQQQDGEVVSFTRVTKGPDGRELVLTRTLTRAEARIENRSVVERLVRAAAAREQAAQTGVATPPLAGHTGTVSQPITHTGDYTTCDSLPNSIWMWDTTARDGYRICFDDPGSVYLSNYQKCGKYWCVDNWSQQVRSFYAGNEAGSLRYCYFVGDSEYCGTPQTFAAWESSNTNSYGSAATKLTLWTP